MNDYDPAGRDDHPGDPSPPLCTVCGLPDALLNTIHGNTRLPGYHGFAHPARSKR